MKLKKNNWTESYGGRKIFETSPSNFEDYSIIKVYQREKFNDYCEIVHETVINTTGFNRVHTHDWTVLDIKKDEFYSLKKMCINKITEKIITNQEKIATIQPKWWDKIVDVTVSTNASNRYFDLKGRKYCEFRNENFHDNWNTHFTTQMSVKELFLKGIVHENNCHNDNFGFVSYKVIIHDKEIVKTIKKLKWSDDVWDIKYLTCENKKLKEYLNKAINLQYDDL